MGSRTLTYSKILSGADMHPSICAVGSAHISISLNSPKAYKIFS